MPALLSLLSRSLPAVLCSAALLANVAAQECGAALGSPAPTVDVERWVRASLRAPQDAPRLRVVHFWSAQSDACRRWLPLLTELQLDYGAQGLEVTSVASDGHGSPDAGAADAGSADTGAEGAAWAGAGAATGAGAGAATTTPPRLTRTVRLSFSE